MKIIRYQLLTEVNLGTEDEPNIQQTLSAVEMPYTEANYQLALAEAYQGQVTVEDDGQPDPNEAATGPSQDDINKFMLMQTQDANDGIALAVPTLYNVWEPGKHYGSDGDEKIVRVPSGSALKGDYLYRCIQPHTSQADWQPQITPALWTRIDKSHEGSESGPIPATRGMEYTYGKYYLDPEDEKVYLCKRTGKPEGGVITLHYLPHELIGHYFEEV